MQRTIIVIDDHDGMRVDRWFKKNVNNIPQGLIQKFLRVGKIKVNKKKIKNSYKVAKNDKILLYDIDIKPQKIDNKKYIPTNKIINKLNSEIIYDNEDYLVLSKEAGISVQGGTKSKKNLIDIFRKSKLFLNTQPYSVHRLDKDTSGIIIIAKNRKSAQLFTSLFRLRKIHKTYLAICEGEFENNSGTLEHNLERYEKDKKIKEKAITKYKVINKNNKYTFIELKPITGRKHQIRKQTSYIGNAILGDQKYSYNKKKYKNMFLHAYSLKFMINEKKYTFNAKLPFYFTNLLNRNRFNYSNYI